jgi:hypothetical protein
MSRLASAERLTPDMASTGPVFVSSKHRDSVQKLSSDVLRQSVGGITINVYVSPFGSGIRRLVNNRYIIAHAVSALDPYSNVVSLARGPRRFVGEDIKLPTWKVWLVNEAGTSRLLRVDDSEQLLDGWHNFVLRWNHAKPILELLVDGKVVLAEPDYTEAWPTRFTTEISIGAWPKHWTEHYIETCIDGWSTLDQPFNDEAISRAVARIESLEACKEK